MTTAEWRAAWVAALEELELDVERAETLLRRGEASDDQQPWSPPELPPLPIDLAPRARLLLQRQLAAAEELTRLMVVNRQHAVLADRMQTREPQRPVYVDRAC